MPRWGRPPGARLGRQTRRRVDGDGRIEEIDTEDEFFMQDGQAIHARQLARMDLDGRPGLRRRMLDFDEAEAVNGMDFDLYSDADSTVAYAVQLAMKDKDDWLVEKALERIRNAQMLGKKNVRLSQRELEALERKRMHTAGTVPYKTDNYRVSQYEDPGRTGSPRAGSNTARQLLPPYSRVEGSDGYASWAKTSNVQTPGPPSLRTQLPVTASPKSPSQTPYSERFSSSPLTRSPVSLKSPTFSRPLPDDPQWVPPAYQVPHSPYSMHSPADPRRSPGRAGMVPYMTGYPSPYSERHTRPATSSRLTPSASEDSNEEDEENRTTGNGDEVRMVDVVERRVPATPTRKGGTRRRSKHA